MYFEYLIKMRGNNIAFGSYGQCQRGAVSNRRVMCALNDDSWLTEKELRWIFQQHNEAVYGRTGRQWEMITLSITGV